MKRIILPILFQTYGTDFGSDLMEIANFVAKHTSGERESDMRTLLDNPVSTIINYAERSKDLDELEDTNENNITPTSSSSTISLGSPDIRLTDSDTKPPENLFVFLHTKYELEILKSTGNLGLTLTNSSDSESSSDASPNGSWKSAAPKKEDNKPTKTRAQVFLLNQHQSPTKTPPPSRKPRMTVNGNFLPVKPKTELSPAEKKSRSANTDSLFNGNVRKFVEKYKGIAKRAKEGFQHKDDDDKKETSKTKKDPVRQSDFL